MEPQCIVAETLEDLLPLPKRDEGDGEVVARWEGVRLSSGLGVGLGVGLGGGSTAEQREKQRTHGHMLHEPVLHLVEDEKTPEKRISRPSSADL